MSVALFSALTTIGAMGIIFMGCGLIVLAVGQHEAARTVRRAHGGAP